MNAKCARSLLSSVRAKLTCADQGKGCVGPYVDDETPTARWSHGEEQKQAEENARADDAALHEP